MPLAPFKRSEFYVPASQSAAWKTYSQDLTATLSFVGDVAGGAVVIDSYSESNSDSPQVVANDTGDGAGGFGQCFTGTGAKITAARFYLQKHTGPTGNAVAKIWSMTGTFGVDCNVGSLLATSDNLDVSTLGAFALKTLTSSGANQYTTTNGTHYVVTFEYGSGTSGNYVEIGMDSTSAGHAGTWVYHNASTGGV